MKGMLKKVLGRGKVAVIAVVVALTVGTASTALAANGGNFILGVLNNTATAITQLTANIANPALKVVNTSTSAGATALNLQTASGKPPMTVNSGTKVNNLNVDRLDGKDSTQLAPILAAQQDPDGGSGIDTSGTNQVNSVSVNAPVNGVLMISGTAYVNSRETAPDDFLLNPKVDGLSATLAGWGAYHYANSGGSEGSRFTLSYTVSQPVSAGSHTVTQDLGGYTTSPSYFYNNNELSVTFIPGTQAAITSTSQAAAEGDESKDPNGE